MAEHRNLTGDSVHEPKAIETASGGQVYVADGLGSGEWVEISDSVQTQIDDSLVSYLNKNQFYLTDFISDVSDTKSSLVVIPVKCELNKIAGVLDGAITVGNAVVTIYKNGASQTQNLTIPFAGSAAGTVVSYTTSPAISFNAGDVVELRSDGGSTNAAKFTATLSFTAVT